MAEYIVLHGIRVAKEFQPETHNHLTAVGPKFLVGRQSKQLFECSCGNLYLGDCGAVRSGNTKSCGCAKKGHPYHGKTGSPEHWSWRGMRSRCNKKSSKEYKNYGGRGIKVCERWSLPLGIGFLNFLADMGPKPSPKHSLDRIDVNGDYCPENCRWASDREQAINTRRNAMLTFQGKTQCLDEWAREYGIPRHVLDKRLNRRWPMYESLTLPLGSVLPKSAKLLNPYPRTHR